MKAANILLAFSMVVALGGCKNATNSNNDVAGDVSQSDITAVTDTVAPDLQFAEEAAPTTPAESYFERKARQGSGAAVAAKPAPAAQSATKKNNQTETIYVETDGAQGRVWGHVTMRGDRGTGTIHDWDENTLTVSVTRHGDELFAVDQNSRQYVFKLRK